MKHDIAIRMTPRVYNDYRKSIAMHPPETAALLGGRLDTPGLITEFTFCPPEKQDGEYQSSSTHVSVDADLMNWIIQNNWQPNGLYVLGLWHSHPGNVTRPSGNGGDIGLFERYLQSDDARAMGWDTVLAPITTFNDKGEDTIHGWTYQRGSNSPNSADIFIHHQGQDYSREEFDALLTQGKEKSTPQVPNRIQEAEFLMQNLALASRRLQLLPGLSWRERRTLRGQFKCYARFELDQLQHRLKSQPLTHEKETA